MTILSNAFYFIIALGILVTFHEFGHFWVARKLGVKVLTFSVGFGRPIWQRRGKDGVNYIIAAIPLGGYVKMLDEREAEVTPEEQSSAFNRKSVWARMAIVLAGPMANFILAVLLYWLMFFVGIDGLSTKMGEIDQNSIAGKAGLVSGDTIKTIDGEKVVFLQDVIKSIALRIGEKTEMTFEVESQKTNKTRVVTLDLQEWSVDSSNPDLLLSLGIRHKVQDPDLPVIIGFVTKGLSADNAGIQVGDRIRSFNSEPVKNWKQLVSLIEPSANKSAEILIERDGELRAISVVIGSQQRDGKLVGFIGVSPDYSGLYERIDGSFGESLELALYETGKMISLTVKLFKKLLTGDISPKSLSGPFSIAEGAGQSARGGLAYFLSFVAMISVNLGFINLLPIPLLDGGHLLFFSFEAIKGKPLSERVQEIGTQIGMMMVFALMAIAIFNDLSRF